MAPSAPKAPAPKAAGNNRAPNTRPAVVPVIPLPLVQKQQQQRQQRQEKEQKEQREQKEQKERKEQKEQKEQKQRREQEKHSKKSHNAKTAPEKAQPKAKATTAKPEPKKTEEPAMPLSDGDATSESTPPTSAGAGVPEEKKVAPSSAVTEKSQTTEVPEAASSAASVTGTEAAPAVRPETEATTAAPSQPRQNGTPTAPSSASRPPRNGPVAVPDFVFPSRMDGGNVGVGPPSRPNYHPNHIPLHQPHPSNSSITFGAFHDSNNTSPAPNNRIPMPPPPPGMMGAPPFMPYNPAMGMGEWSGPPPVMPMHSTINGYTHAPAPGHGPTPGFSTPGSFHSQSPDTVADGGYGQQRAGPFPVPGPNGSMAPRNDGMPAMLSPHMPPPHFPGNGMNGGRNGDNYGRESVYNIDSHLVRGLQQQVQSLYGNMQAADCHLIVHLANSSRTRANSPGGGASPVQEPGTTFPFFGHRAVLSQSYVIAQVMRNDMGSVHHGPFGQPVVVYNINIDDPYISTPSVLDALQSLYGYTVSGVEPNDSESRSQTMDRALANLTAGFMLMLQGVETTGVRQVLQLLGWDTVEKVLAYCLNGAFLPNTFGTGSDAFGLPYPDAEFRYGRGPGLGVRQLLRGALDFIVHNFPADFVFNGTNAAAAGPNKDTVLSRFPPSFDPSLPAVNSIANGRNGFSGQVVNGSNVVESPNSGSVSLPNRVAGSHGKPNSRSSKIVFGDFSNNDTAADGTQKTNGVAGTPADTTAAILSRILTNLPFGYLKYILQQRGLGAPMSKGIIAEREHLRQLAISQVQSGRIPEESDAILSRIQNSSPPLGRNYALEGWDVLGWKELRRDDSEEVVRIWAQSEPTTVSQ